LGFFNARKTQEDFAQGYLTQDGTPLLMLLIANLLVLSVACGQINGLSSRKVTQSLIKCSFARATIKYFGLIERPAELPPCSLSKLLYSVRPR
jgi:hypothetical protein